MKRVCFVVYDPALMSDAMTLGEHSQKEFPALRSEQLAADGGLSPDTGLEVVTKRLDARDRPVDGVTVADRVRTEAGG
jgi:hypothetical protein